MYEECLDRLASSGFEQYEISNFARPGMECRHNLCYWRGEEYAGYGPGAVGCVEDRRYTNLKHPERYCAAVEAGLPLAFESEVLDDETKRVERIMLRLRLSEGLDIFGIKIEPRSVARLQERGWVERDSGSLRLTRAGKHFCSEVALELI